MKKPLITLLLLCSTSCLIISCSSNSDKSKVKEEKEIVSPPTRDTLSTATPKEETVKIDAKFSFVVEGMDEESPSSAISVNVNGKKTKLTTVSVPVDSYSKENFKEMGIPENALDACGGWWAGAGDYFYLVATETGVIVFRGWQDEGQEDDGYHWKKEKEIKL